MSKEINARVLLKYDTAANWAQATFTPKKGEMIIYAPSGDTPVRYKIGDGTTPIGTLPFVAQTPVKGVDYFTDDDKTELVNDVLAALPLWDGTGATYEPIETVTTITINGTTYNVVSGHTWFTWCADVDNCNTDNYTCQNTDSKVFVAESTDYVIDSNGTAVTGADLVTIGGVYSIEAATAFTFTIDSTEYTADNGMTWYEWASSDYAPDSYSCTSTESNVYPTGETYVADSEGNAVIGSTLITEGGVYSIVTA